MSAKIINLSGNMEEARMLGINGRRFAQENFNDQRNIEKVIGIYSRLCEK
jgi:hypothetical protein